MSDSGADITRLCSRMTPMCPAKQAEKPMQDGILQLIHQRRLMLWPLPWMLKPADL